MIAIHVDVVQYGFFTCFYITRLKCLPVYLKMQGLLAVRSK